MYDHDPDAALARIARQVASIGTMPKPDESSHGPIVRSHEPVDVIRHRLERSGSLLQLLETIRRELRSLKVSPRGEQLVDQAIEELAAQWTGDRRLYREMT